MRIVLAVVGVVIALSVAWVAGEAHKENCQRAGRVGCSILPWDQGERKRTLAPPHVCDLYRDRGIAAPRGWC